MDALVTRGFKGVTVHSDVYIDIHFELERGGEIVTVTYPKEELLTLAIAALTLAPLKGKNLDGSETIFGMNYRDSEAAVTDGGMAMRLGLAKAANLLVLMRNEDVDQLLGVIAEARTGIHADSGAR